jgi:peptidoglycan/xylan/chitin deacetylase (PgdA/CDA1 family)
MYPWQDKDQLIFILNFHGLGNPPRRLPSDEEDCWMDAGSFAHILDSVNGCRDIQITFDDSNESDYTLALPLLKARGMTARFFIVTGRVDRSGFLSGKQIQSLREEGMELGSHGVNHHSWARLGPKELKQELVDSKQLLEEVSGVQITQAACPFGDYNRFVLTQLTESGYDRVYTSDGGPASSKSWVLPRNTLGRGQASSSAIEAISKVPAGPRAVLRLCKLALKRWL